MISFSPSDDQKMMLDSVAQFAKATLRPRIREFEAARALPQDVRKAAHEMGLGMVALPSEVGGAGLGLMTAVLLEEELAWGEPGAAYGLGGPGAFGRAVVELGSPEQAADYLKPFVGADGYDRFGAVAWGEPRAGSDRAGMSTLAKKHGDDWVLDGEKAYVINADRAESFVVFAQVDPAAGWSGLGAFVVKRHDPRVEVLPRSTTLGLDVASFGGIKLTQVRVGAEARLVGGVSSEEVPTGPPSAAVPGLPGPGLRAGEGFDAALVRFFAREGLYVAARAVAPDEVHLEIVDERVVPVGPVRPSLGVVAVRELVVVRARRAGDGVVTGRHLARLRRRAAP